MALYWKHVCCVLSLPFLKTIEWKGNRSLQVCENALQVQLQEQAPFQNVCCLETEVVSLPLAGGSSTRPRHCSPTTNDYFKQVRSIEFNNIARQTTSLRLRRQARSPLAVSSAGRAIPTRCETNRTSQKESGVRGKEPIIIKQRWPANSRQLTSFASLHVGGKSRAAGGRLISPSVSVSIEFRNVRKADYRRSTFQLENGNRRT